MGEPAIEVEGLVKRYGAVVALAGVDLSATEGTVVGLLGPNGAGKTTLVRILATLLRPDAGRARVAGLDVVTEGPAVRRAIGLTGQFAAVDGYLTGRENLRMIAQLSGLRRRSAVQRADELLEMLDLTGAAGRRVRSYSGGMRRRLDVAASLVRRPAVLFLDEPTTGLDPRGRLGLWSTITALAEQGTTVLLTTQYLEEADRLADSIAVIDAGRVIASGTAAELKAEVGGERLEIRIPPGDDVRRVVAAIADLAVRSVAVDKADRIVVRTADGLGALGEVAAELKASGVPIIDLALRRPSLDDVFLALTGHPAGDS